MTHTSSNKENIRPDSDSSGDLGEYEEAVLTSKAHNLQQLEEKCMQILASDIVNHKVHSMNFSDNAMF